MRASTPSLAALVIGLALLCGLAVGSASATADVQTTDLVDNTTDELNESTEELNESTGELAESTDDAPSTSDSGTDTLGQVTNTTGGDGDVDLDEPDSVLPSDRTERTLESGLESSLSAVESLRPPEMRSNETVLSARLDTVLGQVNSSVAIEPDSGSSADDSSESADDDSGRTGAMAPSASGSSDVIDAGLVGMLGGLTLLGGMGSGSGAGASAGAGAAGATSTLFGQTVGSVLRLLGGASGLAGKLPLSLLRYSRYDDSDPLEHDTRCAIYESIETEPGRYLTALETNHDVSLSTIRHHLSVLEDEGLVEARKQSGKRRYYPARTDGVELAAALDEPAKADILRVLATVGEAHNGRLADELELDPSTVSHHVSTLESDGLVERRRDGRTVINTLAPGVEGALPDRAENERMTNGRPVSASGDD